MRDAFGQERDQPVAGTGSLDLLFLTEGDAERAAGAGSGTPLSIVRGLRAIGHHVRSYDADLHGASKLLGAALSFWPQRQRWAVRYHMSGVPFGLRSSRVRGAVREQYSDLDAILQYGATFDPGGQVPYYLYCDSTIKIAARYPEYSWAGQMAPGELASASNREQRVYRGARRIFTFSDHVADLLAADFGIPRDRVTTVYAGPNVDASRVSRRDRAEPASDNILFVGREFERKGGDTLLRAFALVRERFPAATLTIVGPRDLRIDQPGVVNVGYLNSDDPTDRDRLVRAYADATLFCFPTRYEPFGLAVLEAMYAGLPCVATRAWAIPEMVVDGETGYTASAGDVDAFADAVGRLLADKDLSARMGAAARARAERHFSWEAVTRAMSDWITRDLGGDARVGGR